MKKILILLSTVGLLSLTGCNTNDDDFDNDTFSEVFELNDVDFTPDNNGRYSVLVPLDPVIYDSDVILVYRSVVDDGFVVWQPIPRTLYLDNGDEVDYDFNFTTDDLLLYMGSTYDLAATPQFTQNQVFRIVIVPGYFSSTVDTNNYDAVMSALSEKAGKQVEVQSIK
jgi:hypothetical protein